MSFSGGRKGGVSEVLKTYSLKRRRQACEERKRMQFWSVEEQMDVNVKNKNLIVLLSGTFE